MSSFIPANTDELGNPRKVYVEFYQPSDPPAWHILRGSIGDMVLLADNEFTDKSQWRYVNTREIRSMR